MTEQLKVRCAGCGKEMANPSIGEHTGQWLYYCSNCRKQRDNDNEEQEEDEE